MIGSLIMGAIVGWIAGKLMNVKGGILRNIIVGLVGSFVGGAVFGLIGFSAHGLIANLIVVLWAPVSPLPSHARSCAEHPTGRVSRPVFSCEEKAFPV